MKLNSAARKLLSQCNRGGRYSYYWAIDAQENKQSTWYSTGIITDPQNHDGEYNLFFGIYPTNTQGTATTRAKTGEISAVSCLYSDCDINKGWDLDRVNQLQPAPTWIISTGGGWHAYWILTDPVKVTDENRAELRRIVKGWVKHIGGDAGAADLTRVLRLPGSLNYKYQPARKVEIVQPDNGARYDLAELAGMIPQEKTPQERAPVVNVVTTGGDLEQSAENLLESHLRRIEEIGGRNKAGFSLAGQLRDLGLSQADAENYLLRFRSQAPRKDHEYTEKEALDSLKSAYNGTRRDPPQSANFSNYEGIDYAIDAARVPTGRVEPSMGVPAANEPQEPEFPPIDDWLEELHSPAQTAEAIKAQARARYVVRTAADALQPQPPIEYIVDKLLTAGSLAVFYGEPGDGKTYSLISMGVCVAAGLPWLDFQTKQGPVLIIDEESGENRLARRLSEALRGELCDESTPIYYVSLAGFHMDDKNDPTILQALIEEYGARLVIIDALADVMGGDENSKEDTQPVFTELRKIADRTGAAIALIHHSNKAGGYRGSSAIKGAVGLMVKVEKEKSIITFTTEKNWDGEKPVFSAVATWIDSEGTFSLRSWTVEKQAHLSKAERHVIEYLTDNGAQSTNQIMDAAAVCSPQSARQAIYKLADMGKIKRTNPGEKVAIYELSICNEL